jgi:hypothetical protein
MKGYIKTNKISWRVYHFETRFFGKWAYQHQFSLGRFMLLPKYQMWEVNESFAKILGVPTHAAYCFEWLWWGVVLKKRWKK